MGAIDRYDGFPLSSRAVPRFEWRDEIGSTNTELVRLAGEDAGAWPDRSVLVTDEQTAGRGRLGRKWMAPTGKTLAISVLLRPEQLTGVPLQLDAYGWLPLLAGAAMTETVRDAVADAGAAGDDADEEVGDGTGGVEVALKWPNDVLVSGFKVCGILSELLPDGRSVVVGAGLNLSLDEHDLPTLASTSLQLVTGRAPDADAVLADYLARFTALYRGFAESGGDPIASGLAERVGELCGTIGAEVRVELPGDAVLLGTAEGIDVDGRLLVRDRENGELQAVAAGDITHLRY